MSATGFSPIQAGVYGLLTGDVATLMPMIDGVFDAIPADKKYVKYVVLGTEVTETPFRTFGPKVAVVTSRGHTEKFAVHVWTKDKETGAGSKLTQQILDRVTELMESGAIAVANHQVVLCQLDMSDIMESIDNLTNELWRHGVARFEITVQDTT